MYRDTIREIDPSVNAVGVECSMRVQYRTLDHLSRATFRAEIAIARDMEKDEPGILRMLAESDGMADAYDRAEALRKTAA